MVNGIMISFILYATNNEVYEPENLFSGLEVKTNRSAHANVRAGDIVATRSRPYSFVNSVRF